jgi:hypothetical protein
MDFTGSDGTLSASALFDLQGSTADLGDTVVFQYGTPLSDSSYTGTVEDAPGPYARFIHEIASCGYRPVVIKIL